MFEKPVSVVQHNYRFVNGGPMLEMGVNTNVPRAQVNAGDAFTFLAKGAPAPTTFTTTLPPYFVTTPAIHSATTNSVSR